MEWNGSNHFLQMVLMAIYFQFGIKSHLYWSIHCPFVIELPDYLASLAIFHTFHNHRTSQSDFVTIFVEEERYWD